MIGESDPLPALPHPVAPAADPPTMRTTAQTRLMLLLTGADSRYPVGCASVPE